MWEKNLILSVLFQIILAENSANAWIQMKAPGTPCYHGVGFSRSFSGLRPTGVELLGQHLVAYRNQKNKVIIHNGVCQHQGFLLKHGYLSKEGTLHCNYHGFEFDEGCFVGIPNPAKKAKKHRGIKCMPLFDVLEQDGVVWIDHKDNLMRGADVDRQLPYMVPEQYDKNFRCVEGSLILDVDQDMVYENLLDILHISYVHSFGSRTTPIPFDQDYQDLSVTEGICKNSYRPNPATISVQMGNVEAVVVENEFHLPGVTVTRVTAGKIVKTVWTSTVSMGCGKTLLLWRVYRNFWKDNPKLPLGLDFLGDTLIGFLMRRTLAEDQDVLSKVDPNRGEGVIQTKFDQIIIDCRKKKKIWVATENSGYP